MLKKLSLSLCVIVIVTSCMCMLENKSVYGNKNDDWRYLKELYYESESKLTENINKRVINNERVSNEQLNKLFFELEKDENKEVKNNYGGAYIDAEGKLVVCVTDVTEKNIDVIKRIAYKNGININKVKYSKDELIKQQEDIMLTISNIKTGVDNYNFLDRLQGIGLDEENNKINIYIEELNLDDIEKFNELFDYDNISFISEDGSNEENTTWKPGRAIYVRTSSNTYSVVSTGYRAYYQSGAYTYYGFVTCGHGIENSTDGYVYSDSGLSTRLGKIYKAYNTSKCDASFVYLSYTAYTRAAYVNIDLKYKVDNSTYYKNHELETYTYMTSVAKNSSVCFEGSTSYFLGGKITDTNCAAFFIEDGFVFNLYKTNMNTSSGDSGGILYYIDENNECIPCGTLVGGALNSYFTKAFTSVSYLGITPY